MTQHCIPTALQALRAAIDFDKNVDRHMVVPLQETLNEQTPADAMTEIS